MRKHRYPLPERTVHYSKKKHLEPIPEAGKKYHCFDDGKITVSRHYLVEVLEVLGHQKFKKKYPKYFKRYIKTAKDHYWLYSRRTDKFIVCQGENNELGVFVRTKQGGWFGIGDWWNSGVLDVSGKLWNSLIANLNLFELTEEEKEEFLKENTI